MQFSIWEKGDRSVDHLEGMLLNAVRQALCDFVTEYGLFVAPLLVSLHQQTLPLPLQQKSPAVQRTDSWRGSYLVRLSIYLSGV